MSESAAAGRLDELRLRAIGGAGSGLLSALFATCRLEVSGESGYRRVWEQGRPVVFALWHGRLLPGTYQQRGNGLVALISQHKDGEYISRVVERWGYGTVRGSSTRGGSAALRGLLRAVRAGRSVVLTPDGPRGPREQMKPGALIVAQLSGAPVVPVATGARRAWWITGGWDRFLVPQPFSPVRVLYGEPVTIPREIDEAGLARYTAEVETRLNALMKQVDAWD